MKSRSVSSFIAVFGFAVGLTSFTANAVAPEDDFIGRFGGTWSGSGTVIKGDIPLQVNCQATGEPGRNQIAIEGKCSLAIASVRIAADITYDPATGRYVGTYIGAKVGPAHVAGTRSGNVVRLIITWPKPVNGDTEARMTIENTGNGNFRIVVTDNTAPGGPEQTTHDLVLSQI